MRNLIAILMAAVIMTGCANSVVPETGTERYVVADAAFKALLGTIGDAVFAGRISPEFAPRLKTAIAAISIALDAWAIAPNDLNAETTALLALQAARTLLLSLDAVSGDPGSSGVMAELVFHRYTPMETLS